VIARRGAVARDLTRLPGLASFPYCDVAVPEESARGVLDDRSTEEEREYVVRYAYMSSRINQRLCERIYHT
jgi:hypothetical protein